MLDAKCLCQYTIGVKLPTMIEADEYRRSLEYFKYDSHIGRLFCLLYDKTYITISMITFKVVPSRGEALLINMTY